MTIVSCRLLKEELIAVPVLRGLLMKQKLVVMLLLHYIVCCNFFCLELCR